MSRIYYRINQQNLNISIPTPVVSGSINYVSGYCTFSDEWATVEKFVFFTNESENITYKLLLKNDSFGNDVGVNLKAGVWKTWVIGYSYEKGAIVKRISTNVREFTVLESGVIDGVNVGISPDVGEQILGVANNAVDKANEAIEAVGEIVEAYETGQLAGPPGPAGPAGPQGPVGPKGDKGDGLNILGRVDNVSDLDALPKEPNSSYYVGTIPPYDVYTYNTLTGEWDNAGQLQGPTGEQGPVGPQGEQGVPGPKGDTGATGPQGPIGETGPKGDTGNSGVFVGDSMPEDETVRVWLAPNGTATMFDVIRDSLGYVPGMVNPNILVNWYFGNPVNQRGFESYNGSDAKSYTVDHWWTLGQNTRLALSDVGMAISVVNQGVGGYIYQTIENGEKLKGKEVTISALCEGNILLSGTFTTPDDYNTEFTRQFYEATGTYAVSIDISGGEFRFRIWQKGTTPATVIACKLELGDKQTLVRQINGEWVLNEIPDYGEQLAKCQRYFQRFQNRATDVPTPINIGLALGTSSFILTIPLVTPMRAFPAISIPNISAIKIRDGVGNIVATATAFGSTGGLSTNGGYLSRSFYCNVDNTYTLGTAQYFYMDIGGYIDFTAEL